MRMTQRTAHAPRAAALASEAVALPGCIGCPGCRGMCRALIELLTVPDAVAR